MVETACRWAKIINCWASQRSFSIFMLRTVILTLVEGEIVDLICNVKIVRDLQYIRVSYTYMYQ